MRRDDRQAGLLEWLAPRIEPQSGVPIYMQLQEALCRAISAGQLRPGDALPTVRALAAGLRLAPNTVSRAYAALQREGLTENRAGAGTVVAAGAWEGRLEQQGALRELRELLAHLLSAGITPTEVRQAVEAVLAGLEDTGEKEEQGHTGN